MPFNADSLILVVNEVWGAVWKQHFYPVWFNRQEILKEDRQHNNKQFRNAIYVKYTLNKKTFEIYQSDYCESDHH